MSQVGEVYLCEICGNKVKVLEAGGGVYVVKWLWTNLIKN